MTNINNEYADVKLYQLGGGAAARGAARRGGGAGAARWRRRGVRDPNQRRYSFIMNGFKKNKMKDFSYIF